MIEDHVDWKPMKHSMEKFYACTNVLDVVSELNDTLKYFRGGLQSFVLRVGWIKGYDSRYTEFNALETFSLLALRNLLLRSIIRDVQYKTDDYTFFFELGYKEETETQSSDDDKDSRGPWEDGKIYSPRAETKDPLPWEISWTEYTHASDDTIQLNG